MLKQGDREASLIQDQAVDAPVEIDASQGILEETPGRRYVGSGIDRNCH